MTSTSKPVVFISSTIYDFADLRSCARYFLEELGYRVQLSESSDFDKPLEPNSYDACFDAIRRADVFLLLVGARRGGWYDHSNRVSITQAEYRVAYEQAKVGRIKLLPCVRASTWEHVAVLKSVARDSWVPSKFSEDPSHLIDFLEEIGRVPEMRDSATGTDRPRNNWIHQFGSFRDLVNILGIALGTTVDIDGTLLLDVVAKEVAEYAVTLLGQDDHASWLLRNIVPLSEKLNQLPHSMDNLGGPKIDVPIDLVARLGSIALSLPQSTPTQFVALERAITSSSLADVIPGSAKARASAVQMACRRTLAAFRELEAVSEWDVMSSYLKEAAGSKDYPSWPLSIVLIAQTALAGVRHACAILEAENLVNHIRHEAPLHHDPCMAYRVNLLPNVNHARVPRGASAFESWAQARHANK